MITWLLTLLKITVGYELMQATDSKQLLVGSLSLPISSANNETDSQPQYVAVAGWTRILEPSILFTLRELPTPTRDSQTVLQLSKSQDYGFRLETDDGRTIIAGGEKSGNEDPEWEYVLVAVAVHSGWVRLCRKSWGGTVNCRKADFPGVGSNGLTLEAEGVVGKVHIVGVVVVHGVISEREMEEISGEMCMDECEERCWGPGVMSCSGFVGLPPPTKSSSIDQQLTIFPLVALIPEPLAHPLNSEMSVSLWVRTAAENHLLLTSLFKLISSDVNSPQVLSGHVSPSGDLVVCLDTETQNAANCIPQRKLQPGEWSFIVVAKDGYRVTLCQGDIRSPRLECDCVDFYSSLSENTNGELIISAVAVDWEWRTNGGGLTVTDIRYYNNDISTSEAERLFSRTQSMCKDTDIQKCKLLSAVESVSAEPRRLQTSHIARFESYSWETAGYYIYYTITNNHLSTLYINFQSYVSDGYVCTYVSKAPNTSSYYWSFCSSSYYSSIYLYPTSSYIAGTASGLQGTYTIRVYPYRTSYTYYYNSYYSYYSHRYYSSYYYYTYWSNPYPWVYILVSVSCSSTTSACFCPSGNYPAPTLSSCKPCPADSTLCPSSVAQSCLPVNRSSYPSSGFTCQSCYNTKMTYDKIYGCSCFPPCYSCSGSGFNMCNSCYSDSVLSGTTCVCRAGYYKLSATSYYCGICSSKCATCSGASSTQCLTCKANAVLKSGSCACVDGYGGTADYCQRCYPSCLTCITTLSNSCTSCNSLAHLQSVAPSYCICNNGYFPNWNAGNCAGCNANCLTCTGVSSNNCSSCKANAYLYAYLQTCYCVNGYYGPPSNCQPCDSTCAACSLSGANKCTACRPNATLASPSPNVCTCVNGFYVNAYGACAACHTYCLTCTGPTESQCVTCKGNAHVNTGACVCNTRYYPNPTVDKCAGCNSACNTCVGALATQCDGCYPNAVLLKDGTCVCNDGYFTSSTAAACVACSSLCKTCISSSSKCTSCFFPAELSSFTCRCSDGYYPDPDAVKCSLCHFTCETCSGPDFNMCKTCPANSTLSTGICSCPSSNCVACHNTCNTCKGPTAGYCIDCKAGANLLNSTAEWSYCVCEPGKYSFQGGCVSCDQKCAECVGATDADCSACDLNASLVGGKAPSSCQCDIGFYVNTSGTMACLACDVSCLTCNNTPSNCLSCYPNASLISSSVPPTCICNLHFFPDTTSKDCKSCHSTCKECDGTSSVRCVSCHQFAEIRLTGTDSECVCSQSYFPDQTSANCKVCDATCKDCLGPTNTDCTVCFSLAHLENDANPAKCVCDSTTFTKSTAASCNLCHNDCYKCNDSKSTDCTECYPHASLAGGTAISSCVCDPMYLPMPSVKTCIFCHSTCSKCSHEGESFCTECYPNAVLASPPGPSKCNCILGYYAPISTAECILCASTCKKCVGTGEFECTECFDNAELIDGVTPSGCKCKEFTFADTSQSDCKKCDTTCKKCMDTTDSACLECFSNAGFDSELPPAKCICKDNAYTLSDSSHCLLCDSTCAKCTDAGLNNCTDCYKNAKLSTGKSCECEDGFFPNPAPNLCLGCHETCLHCTDITEDTCTGCYPNAVLQGSICICPDGFFPKPSAAHCVACAPTCFTCIESLPDKCSSCHTHAGLPSGSTVADCQCDTGFFPNPTQKDCSPCHKHCFECVNDSASDCISCPSFGELAAGSPSACKCVESAYPDPDVTKCSPCSLTCKSCIASEANACISCWYSAELSGASPNACRCKTGFWPAADVSHCVECSAGCETCLNVEECVSCKPSRVLSGKHCQCGEQYFANPDASNCVKCGDGCEKCSNKGCTRCMSEFYSFSGGCVKECPIGTRGNDMFECHEVDLTIPKANLEVLPDNSLNITFNKNMTFTDLTALDFQVEVIDELNRSSNVGAGDPDILDPQTLFLTLLFSPEQYIPAGTSVQLTFASLSKILDSNEFTLETDMLSGVLYEFGTKPENTTPSALLTTAAQTAAATSTAATSSSLAISFISGNPATLISMVNQMQILSYSAMSKVEMGEDLRGTLAAINMASAFSIPYLSNPLKIEEKGHAAPSYVQAYGIPTTLFLKNAAPALSISTLTLVSFVPIYLLSRLPCAVISTYFSKMVPSLTWSVPMKLWLTSYLDLGVLSFLQVRWASDSFSNLYAASNFILALFFFATTIVSPFLLLRHIVRNYSKFADRSDPDFIRKWGVLVDEFKPGAIPSVVGFYVLFTLRRLITIISITLLFDTPHFVACISFLLSLWNLAYLIICRPYATALIQVANICNEAGICFVFLMSGFVFLADTEMREGIENLGVMGVQLALFANLAFAVIDMMGKMVELVREFVRVKKVMTEKANFMKVGAKIEEIK